MFNRTRYPISLDQLAKSRRYARRLACAYAALMVVAVVALCVCAAVLR